MSFLKKRKSTIYGHSRSGSGSVSSIRTQATPPKYNPLTAIARNADPANIGEAYSLNSDSKPALDDSKQEKSLDENTTGSVKGFSDSRKSSSESTNSLTSEKLLFTWDVTDPNQWTMTRVIQWFRSNDFSDTWILFFKRNNIKGNGFLKLLAHDNFVQYEKFLPATKTSCYDRFQYLLKKTLEENVIKGYNRNTNKATVSPRSSSESATFRPLGQKGQTTTHTRSTSESALSYRPNHDISYSNNGQALMNKDINEAHLPLRHGKANNSSALYRRSLISLRNTSSARDSSSSNEIKITIPSRPLSTIENSNKSPCSPLSPNVSQSYSGLFRRHQKSSSSESSLFNSIFGGSTSEVNKEDRASDQRKASTVDMSSPYKLSPYTSDDKAKLWDKIKKKSGTPELVTQIAPRSSAVETIEESPNVVPSTLKLPEKYYPTNIPREKSVFLLLTTDSKSFTPFDASNFMDQDLSKLRSAIGNAVGKTTNDFTIHLTDFGSEHGSAIPDELLKSIQEVSFEGTSKILFINSSIDEKTRKAVFTNVRSNFTQSSPSSRGKTSVKSTASSQSGDASSDLNSLEDHFTTPRRAYPKTPSQYYDNTASAEGDYWSVKEGTTESASLNVPKMRQNKAPNGAISSTPSDHSRTFRIIRKASDTDIDFNKRRESPYARVAELEPKRDAPKPPIMGSQLSLTLTHPAVTTGANHESLHSAPKLERKTKSAYLKRKMRPPPPGSLESVSNKNSFNTRTETSDNTREQTVQSYTPASTQVMIPQPYKGATETLKTRKSSGDIGSKVLIPIGPFSRSNSSLTKSLLSSPQSTLTTGNSRRVVSSTGAADVFDENEISFSDAPELSDSGEEYYYSSDEIIWSTNGKQSRINTPEFSFNKSQTRSPSAAESVATIVDITKDFDQKKMTLRPSAEVVYENLEKFFPDADLDNPILEGLTPPPSPNAIISENSNPKYHDISSSPSSREETPVPFLSKRFDSSQVLTPVKTLSPPKRTKTIRIIAQEASDARRNKNSSGLRRKNTKMWGTKVVEITDKRMISINKSRNSKGEFKEFAWIKGEIIGKGSFGAVFLGLNVTTGEMIAVKQVAVPEFSSQNEAAISMVDALKSEVSTLKDLDHLNIVQYLGFEEKNGIYSLFLEYVAGGSVGSLIRMNGPFDDQLIRHLTLQVLKGLSYLHSKGILHRDMKADNLLLDNDGVCKISDFGISKKSNNIYSNSDMTMRGTVFWMAPEMVDTAHGYSAKVDIWSLGCIVLEMFAGRRPWSNYEVVAAMFQIGKSKTAPPIPEDTKPLVSKEGLDFLDKCFEVDPDLRPTAGTLVTHAFCKTNPEFDFSSTDLAKFIRSNDKLNNSRLRIESLEI